MDIEVSLHKQWVELNVVGRLDSFNFESISNKVQTLRKMGKKYISLNLDGVNFVNVGALHFFVNATQSMKSEGGTLLLLYPAGKVKERLERFNSPKVLNIAESYEQLEQGRIS